MAESTAAFGPTEAAWLHDLVATPTVSPFEGGSPAELLPALDLFAAGAERLGCRLEYRGAPAPEFVQRDDVPEAVRDVADAAFLQAQPSLVMSLGSPCPPERRLVVNAHLDTVGPHLPARLDGGVLRGRGVVDAKGPAVAALAGAAAAFREAPHLDGQIQVLLAAVPGEEGGAMGTYGTRWLVEQGFVGRLMLFAEPTGSRVLDASTATMTPTIHVAGSDSTDDHPGEGHNATIALGFLADHLAARLGPAAAGLGAKVCIAGLHTGTSHNRVYGAGQLAINIAYQDASQAGALQDAFDQAWTSAAEVFRDRHRGNPVAERIAADWAHVVRVRWAKRGLPVLANRDAAMESVLASAGLIRDDALADGSAFTCDAIWAGHPDRYVAVCGPGRLDANGAHTPDEWIALDDLRSYAERIRALVHTFATHLSSTSTPEYA